MAEQSGTSIAPEIRILGLNTDKTRRTLGSTDVYQVYFELSANPHAIWREMFGREWKKTNPSQEAGLDGNFLVIHCHISEVAGTQLPALKKAIGATNVAFRQYKREQATEEERKENIWKDERKTVEDMAKTLRFD